MYNAVPDLVEAKAENNFSLYLSFADGTDGIIDLSDIKRIGLFEIWNTNFQNFRQRKNIISWSDDCEIDADSLYLKLIKKDFFEYAGN